ncbi:cupredoxin domain-containing protein [Candidatus Villigracilis affinis]|uniref:cupredoxin domain-containing protein n=1 Tax=Candidatus Villigracilis affinis TaxID=3140682 RepID=UPI001B63EC54|nr:cupredoxin domain-containing protein [Anaerolineales bacterium]MBL0345522.1 cupredoxin domain-containing protein [Anaerolineales bacterium]MBP8048533.1 cupredoxin domain-containing protein [Anaerolineales bacterium]
MRKVFSTIMLVCMFIVTACGGNRPSTNLKVDMVEFIFTPAEFVIPAGQEITITAVNNGAVIHEFVIMNFGQTIGDDFGDEDEGNIYWEVEAEPGKTVTATFTAPTEPGEYQVVCGTEGHFIAGMVGKLTVVAP